MIAMSPALARGAAQLDFQGGCDLGDNPFPGGSEAYWEWESEMRYLLQQEALRELEAYDDSEGSVLQEVDYTEYTNLESQADI